MSSFTRAMSAASIAMSLPTPPIAIPASAFFRAGASFIAVAYHADGLSRGLAGADVVQLVLREAAGAEFVYPGGAGDALRRARMVAGQQHGLDPGALHALDCLRRVRPERVGENNEARCGAVDGDIYGRRALSGEFLRGRGELMRDGGAAFLEELRASGEQPLPADGGADAPARAAS